MRGYVIHLVLLAAAVAASAYLLSYRMAPEISYVRERPSLAPTIDARPAYADYPKPSALRHFTYAPEKPIDIKEACADAYVTVIVYPADIDYRADPAKAIYNVAHPCAPGSSVERTLDFTQRPVIGKEYYMVVADQGEGEWYNPR